MKTDLITELQEQASRLHSLLRDPQPGISSWVALLDERMRALTEVWNRDRTATEETSR